MRFTKLEAATVRAMVGLSATAIPLAACSDKAPADGSAKAYFLDSTEGRLLLWNPEQMSVTGEIALPTEAREGFSFNFGEAMVLRDDGTLLIALDTAAGGVS